MNPFGQILTDNTSGSGAILQRVQRQILQICRSNNDLDLDSIRRGLDELVGAFPQFGLLLHFHRYLYSEIQSAHPMRTRGATLADAVEEYQKKWVHAQKAASHELMAHLDLHQKQVLLHSNSSAIHNLFKEAKEAGQNPTVWQTYSSPEGEGKLQAGFLLDLGFEVNLFHEDNLNKFAGKIDFAILGADIMLDKRFLNKSGSLSIALILAQKDIPVYLLAEPRKQFAESTLTPEELRRIEQEENKPPSSLKMEKRDGLHIYNYYFEFIPLELIKQVFLG